MSFNGNDNVTTLIDALLTEQRTLTAVERFSRHHDSHTAAPEEKFYRALMPTRAPNAGEQYAFEVDLDACSGCKACVAGCHSLNGLDENETWREVGLLLSTPKEKCGSGGECSCSGDNAAPAVHDLPFQQTVTSACHHCVDPGCLNGCPVKAYDKDPETGIVRHLDDQCMGCQYCVMKCPYEVPKYSEKLGIVRKCDMCVNRLAVGEAPACVQSCPNGAIKITLVKKDETRAAYCNNGHSSTFLADSPNPAITVPSTRFVTKRTLENLFAADHSAPRLDHPHWPLVIMLVFTQASVGMFLAATIVPTTPILLLVAFALANIGLLAAPLHLGRPLKAWRAFLGWRTSWLSRELIAFNQFAPIAAAATALAWLPFVITKVPKVAELLAKLPAWVPPLEKLQLPLIAGSAIVGLGSVAVSAMVYVDTKRSFWSSRHSFGAFFGTTLLLGATFSAMVFAWLGEFQFAREFAVVALFVRTALFIWRRSEIHFAAKNPASPIHLNARAIRELLSWSPDVRLALFIASTLFGLLAIANIADTAPLCATLATITTLTSEIVVRYIFFRAGAGKKMPGGIAA